VVTAPVSDTTVPPGRVLISEPELRERVAELGAALSRDYARENPVLVGVLKGALVFMADLVRAMPISLTIDFIALSSYAGGTRSSGVVKLAADLSMPIEDRHVIIVEDVVDTGLTLHFLCRTLALRNPASLGAVTLLDRPYRRLVDEIPLRYVGFTVPDELFAGYGLGLDERWRAFPDLHVVVPQELPQAATEAA
jgi:hypoxanthine phosphoribosyltransferase